MVCVTLAITWLYGLYYKIVTNDLVGLSVTLYFQVTYLMCLRGEGK